VLARKKQRGELARLPADVEEHVIKPFILGKKKKRQDGDGAAPGAE